MTPLSISAVTGAAHSQHLANMPQMVECSQQIQKCICQYFQGAIPHYSLLKGGNVGKVYLLSSPASSPIKTLIFKICAPEEKEKWARELAMCQWAGQHGVGPRVYACDEEGGQILMANIKDGPLPPPYVSWLSPIAERLCYMHSLPFPEAFCPLTRSSASFEIFYQEWDSLKKKIGIPDCMSRMLETAKLLEKKFIDAGVKLVPCHNDTHPQNILVSDQVPFFIDWSLAGPDYAVVELAAVAMHLQLSKGEVHQFLQAYFGKSLSHSVIGLYRSAKAVPYLLKISFPLLMLQGSERSRQEIDQLWQEKRFLPCSHYLEKLASGELAGILTTELDLMRFSLSFLEAFYGNCS